MKNLLAVAYLLLNVNLFGQIKDFKNIPKEVLEQLDKMGIDSCSTLNKYESDYFNVFFHCCNNGFDFTDKKIGFILMGAVRDKKNYFSNERDRFARNYSPNNSRLIILDEDQKIESGGFDAVIIYWTKIYKPTNDIVQMLKKSQ